LHITEREELEEAIAIQESMHGTIPEYVIDVAIAAIRKQLAELRPAQPTEIRKLYTHSLGAEEEIASYIRGI
jgi:hypothetical protein